MTTRGSISAVARGLSTVVDTPPSAAATTRSGSRPRTVDGRWPWSRRTPRVVLPGAAGGQQVVHRRGRRPLIGPTRYRQPAGAGAALESAGRRSPQPVGHQRLSHHPAHAYPRLASGSGARWRSRWGRLRAAEVHRPGALHGSRGESSKGPSATEVRHHPLKWFGPHGDVPGERIIDHDRHEDEHPDERGQAAHHQ